MNRKNLTAIFMAFSLALLAGCANWQTASVYSNQSTPTQTAINAQGTAAAAAASAPTYVLPDVQFNCATCTDAQIQQMYNHQMWMQSELRQAQADGRLGGSRNATTVLDAKAKSDLAKTANWRLDRALDQLMWKLLQDYN